MSLLQYFSNNFFSKIFPTKYFQRKVGNNATVYVTGLQVNISINSVIISTPYHEAKKLPVNTGYAKSKLKLPIHTQVKVKSCDCILSYISDVKIETTSNWETDEEIIEIITIIFKLLYPDNEQQIIVNEEDDEEAISVILANLL